MKPKKKEKYEKPRIVIEKVEFATVAGAYEQPIPQLQPFFSLCPPCDPPD